MEDWQYSVLLPVYIKDRADYFRTSLNSILVQTLMPSQILIMEDGPLTKELDDVIEEYEKRYSLITVVKTPEHLGLGLVLRQGVTLCNYEYIFRMDADDICEPNRAEEEICMLKKRKDLDLVGCIYDEFLEEGKQGPIRMLPETPEEVLKFAKKRNPFGHSSLLIRKQAIVEAGNYRDYKGLEDYDLWIRMLMNGSKGANIQKILVHVRGNCEFYERRGGKEYYRMMKKFFHEYREIGFLSPWEYRVTLVVRWFACVMPAGCRRGFYRKFLRK